MKALSSVMILAICLLPIGLRAQWRLSGQVVDETGLALIGATVQIRNTSIGTTTDVDGYFSLETPEDPDLVLLVRFTGYKSQSVRIGEQRVFEIAMELLSETLDEIVVVGYGTQTRRRITSSIASLDSLAFEGLSTPNFQVGLEGRLPGVVVNQSSGLLGATPIIRIRGPASINADNQPLVVIDGLILQNIGMGPSYGGGYVNPYLNLNPNDIASVEVLKDAAASSIYGYRGANGVILITTKQGRFNMKPQVNIEGQTGFVEASNHYDLLNGKEYASLWNRAAEAIGVPEATGLYYDVDSQPSTDWFDLLARRGLVQEYGANVKGGTAGTRYYFGGGFRSEESYFKYSISRRYSFRANIDQQIGERWSAGLSLAPSINKMRRIGEGYNAQAPNTSASIFFPNVTVLDENGAEYDGIVETSIGMSTFFPSTPLTNLREAGADQTFTQVLMNSYLEYRPIPQVELRTEFGAEFVETEEFFKGSSRTEAGFGADGYGFAQNELVLNYNWTNLLNYRPNLSVDHDLHIQLGSNLSRTTYTAIWTEGTGFADDRLHYLQSAANANGAWSGRTDFGFTGYFSRVNLPIEENSSSPCRPGMMVPPASDRTIALDFSLPSLPAG